MYISSKAGMPCKNTTGIPPKIRNKVKCQMFLLFNIEKVIIIDWEDEKLNIKPHIKELFTLTPITHVQL